MGATMLRILAPPTCPGFNVPNIKTKSNRKQGKRYCNKRSYDVLNYVHTNTGDGNFVNVNIRNYILEVNIRSEI
jgi:hypothetical protein